MKLLPIVLLSACFLSACDSDSATEIAEDLAEDASDDIQEAFTDNQQQFLIDNAAREGVTVTESGLQYEQIREGSGTPPEADDTVTVHYVGTLTNGIEFDSSYARGEPATFPLNGVIAGWQEALQLMPVGSEYQLVIPPELAYGDQGAGQQIGPGAVLIFNVELLEINSQDLSSDEQANFLDSQQQFLTDNAARDGVIVTESGLQYEQLRVGSGASPGPDDVVTVHYAGTLTNGTEFDSSYARGDPATFPLNGVIPGWQEALQLMPVGSEYQLVIPPELAYGDRGAGEDIGPGAVLIFNVELLEINSQ